MHWTLKDRPRYPRSSARQSSLFEYKTYRIRQCNGIVMQISLVLRRADQERKIGAFAVHYRKGYSGRWETL